MAHEAHAPTRANGCRCRCFAAQTHDDGVSFASLAPGLTDERCSVWALSGLGIGGRAVPDISFDADGSTGPLVVWSSSPYDFGPVFVFEGTSVGSPNWAGLVALTDQLARGRVGALNSTLYALAASRARIGPTSTT